MSYWDDIAARLAPYLPPALGAFIGLRWAQNQTPQQKVTGFVAAFALSVYFAPAVSELLALGPKSTIAAGILIAVVGMDILGGLLAAARAFRRDPVGAFRAWWVAWWSRGQS